MAIATHGTSLTIAESTLLGSKLTESAVTSYISLFMATAAHGTSLAIAKPILLGSSHVDHL